MEVFKSIRTAILDEANRQFSLIYQLPYKHLFRGIFKNKQASTERDSPYGLPAPAVYESSDFELERVPAFHSDQRVFFLKSSAEFGLGISTVLIAAVQV